MVLLLKCCEGVGDDVREDDVETDVEWSSNEFVIVSPGRQLLSLPVYVGSLSINGRTTEDRDVTAGGKLVVAFVKGGGGDTWTRLASTGEDGGEEEVSTVDTNSLGGAGISRTIESCAELLIAVSCSTCVLILCNTFPSWFSPRNLSSLVCCTRLGAPTYHPHLPNISRGVYIP